MPEATHESNMSKLDGLCDRMEADYKENLIFLEEHDAKMKSHKVKMKSHKVKMDDIKAKRITQLDGLTEEQWLERVKLNITIVNKERSEYRKVVLILRDILKGDMSPEIGDRMKDALKEVDNLSILNKERNAHGRS